MNKTEKTKRPLWRIPAVLLLLVLITACFGPYLYARYVSSTKVPEQSATVAYFDTDMPNPLETTVYVDMNPTSQPRSFTVRATNGSEVSVRFILETETDGNLPLLFSGITPLVEDSTGCWHFDAPPATAQTPLTFTVAWDPNETGFQYAGGVNFLKLTVSAEQLD